MEIGRNITDGWAGGVQQGSGSVVGAVKSTSSRMLGAVDSFGSTVIPSNFSSMVSTPATAGGGGITNNIQNVTISSEVDGERWLRRLSGNQEIVSNGLVPTQSYM